MSILDKASLIQIPSGYKSGTLYSIKPNTANPIEEISNGDFSGGTTNWSSPDYNSTLSIISGEMRIVSTISLGRVRQGIATIIGKKYLATATITNIDSSTGIQLKLSNGSNLDGAFFDSSFNTTTNAVTITHEFTATATTTYIGSSHGSSIGQSALLDNVSVKRVVSGDGDFTFSRSSSGTRVNSEGLIETTQVVSTTELVTNGDFSSDSDWTIESTWTISGGAANGNGASGSTQELKQTLVNTIGKTYKATFEVLNYVSGTVGFWQGSGISVIPRSANGIYTEYFTATSAEIRFRGTNFNGSIDNVSVKEVDYLNIPRLDYSDGSCPSLLLEGQSTNLLPYSNDFTQWTIQSGVTATHNTTETLSPDGTNNATKFVGNGTTGVFKSGVSVSGIVARSVYLKSVSGTVNVILKDPNVTITQKSLSVTTEWQRFELIEDNTSSSQGLWVDDIPSSGIYMWGGQLESGDYSTSYIPTIGATATRTADVCNNAGTSATFNSTEGVLFAEIAALADDSTDRRITISDGTTNNRMAIGFDNASNKIKYFLISSNTIQVNQDISVDDITQFNKIAFLYKENDFKLYMNGSLIASDTSGSTFSANTLNVLNFAGYSGTSQEFYGKTKQLITFNEALSNEELSDLTGQVNTSFVQLANFYNYTIL